MAIGDYAFDIMCQFINGSDALGCKVVFVSDSPDVENVTTILIRNLRSEHCAQGRLNLSHPVYCYHQMFSFDIDPNNSTGDLAIEGDFATLTDVFTDSETGLDNKGW